MFRVPLCPHPYTFDPHSTFVPWISWASAPSLLSPFQHCCLLNKMRNNMLKSAISTVFYITKMCLSEGLIVRNKKKVRKGVNDLPLKSINATIS